MEERRGSVVSPGSSADGFIGVFKNTDRRDGGEGRCACTLTGTCNVLVHSVHKHMGTRLMHFDNTQPISC